MEPVMPSPDKPVENTVQNSTPADAEVPEPPVIEITPNVTPTKTPIPIRLSFGNTSQSDGDEDSTVHAFNVSNVTVIDNIERVSSSDDVIDKLDLKLNLDRVEVPDQELSKTTGSSTNNDGSDSGVELCGSNFQRTLSNNSGSYSIGYVEDFTATPGLSCNSSIVSCCSNYEDVFELLAGKNSSLIENLSRIGDGTSEGGSESSSVAGSRYGKGVNSKTSSNRRVAIGNTKKKVAVTEPQNSRQSRPKNNGTVSPVPSRSRSRTTTPRVTPARSISSASSTSSATTSATRNRVANSKSVTGKPPFMAGSVIPKAKISILEISPALATKKDVPGSITKGKGTPRGSSVTGRTPGKQDLLTPTDDRRWPSVGAKPTPTMSRSFRGTSITSDLPASTKPRSAQIESKATALEKYATLPRRKREKVPDTKDELKNKFVSRSRDTSLNRTPATIKRQASKEKDTIACKSLPPYPKKKGVVTKTKIYHETYVQTAISLSDVENALQGILSKTIDPEESEKVDNCVQVDRRHETVEKLQAQLKELIETNKRLTMECENKSKKLSEVEKHLAEEREEKNTVKEEMDRNSQRVLAILENDPTCENNFVEDGSDSLLALETQFQKSGQIVVKQEEEISQLQNLCRQLKRDLDRSKAMEKYLIEQQHDMKAESSELHEFIQAEKLALSEVLRDTEEDVQIYRQKLRQKEMDLQKQQDQCKHLVRLSEQRRQENLALQARIGGLEAQSKEMFVQQGASISSASVALSGLSSRLESLVDALVTTYNISDQDLEDVIYHNEAYSNSESSEGSPDRSSSSRKSAGSDGRTTSPSRGASFVTAVISAIRNAASQNPFTSTVPVKRQETEEASAAEYDASDSAELLDSETEPILMMENVLEDVTLPDTHTHNMVSSTHSLLMSNQLGHSESLQNLSQAIISRQEQERLQQSATEMVSSMSECYSAMTLVDQVIDVDNLVTRLLKILRIIQMENDTYTEEILEERSTLAEQVQKQREACESAAEQLNEWQIISTRLKSDLVDVKQSLNAKTTELEEAKSDLLLHRKEVERLNEDVCRLSTICSQTELQLRNREEEANNTLKQWQETGKLPSADVLARLVTARHEIPALKEKLAEKEKQLTEMTEKFSTSQQKMTESWSQATDETRRQYEAIDSALETFLSIQSIVEKCPPLAKLQRDLEETSFKYASSFPLPIVASDCNANANHRLETSPVTAINGTA